MTYDLDKTSLNLFGFKLDSSQKETLEAIIQFLSNKDKEDVVRVVSSSAGKGKTTVAATLINILEQNRKDSYVITPTNKAKNVLGEYIGDPEKVMTIHSFLNLRPNLDVLKFDARDMQFNMDFEIEKAIRPFSVFIVDEGSMINNFLYENLVTKAKHYRSKIVIFCDLKQLAPVKQKDSSKILSSKTYELQYIHRQAEQNPLLKVLDYLREKPIYKLAADLRDSSIIKIITYTNKRIEILNDCVRKILYKDKKEYHYGELLTGYDTCECRGYCNIQNSSDYIVYGCAETK